MNTDQPHPILQVLANQGRQSRWLARQAGFHPVYLSRVFNKHLPATATVREACAKALGVPESELFHSTTTTSEPAEAVA